MKRLALPELRDYVLIDEARIRWELLCGLNILASHTEFPVDLRKKVQGLFRQATEVDGKLANKQIEDLKEEARKHVWAAMHLGQKSTEVLASCAMMVLSSITDCMQTKQSRKQIPWKEEG